MARTSIAAIIPCLNGETFLRRTLSSVFAQTRPLDEIVVVDDGSTDSTSSVLRTYGHAVTVLRHPGGQNRGQGASLNLAVKATSSDLIAFLDHDDIWYPDKTTCQAGVFDDEPGTELVYSNGYVISEEDQNLYPILPPGFAETQRPESILLT